MSIIIEHGGETELEEEFCKIEQLLFSSIVLYQLNGDVAESDLLDDHMNIAPRVLERFLIVPRAQSMPVMINREMTSGYWDHPITELQKNEALIGFVHYYDFCGMDMPRRYEYVRGRILESSKYPEIVGKDLLVPADLAWIEDKKETEQPYVGDGEVQEVTMNVGIEAPLHLHPCPTVGVVTEGQIAFEIEGEQTQHLNVGDAFYEPAHVRVAKFNNDGDTPAKFVVFYLLGENEKKTVRVLEK